MLDSRYDTASGSKGLSTWKSRQSKSIKIKVTIPQTVVKACQPEDQKLGGLLALRVTIPQAVLKAYQPSKLGLDTSDIEELRYRKR